MKELRSTKYNMCAVLSHQKDIDPVPTKWSPSQTLKIAVPQTLYDCKQPLSAEIAERITPVVS